MFGINVENENDLSSPELKNKFYTKVIEDLTSGKPFALDYMFEEKLLSKEDMKERGIQTYKQQAVEILAKIKGPLGRRMKDLIINTGILTSEEADRASITS